MFCDKHKRELVLRVKDIDPSTIESVFVYITDEYGIERAKKLEPDQIAELHEFSGHRRLRKVSDRLLMGTGPIRSIFLKAQHPPRQDPIIRQDKFASSVGLGV